MNRFGKKLISLITISLLFFPLLSIPLPVSAAGSCFCQVQDLTKEGTSHVYKSVSVVKTKETCTDSNVQTVLDKDKKTLNIKSCVWQESGAKTGVEKAEALCRCLNKSTKISVDKKKLLSFKYPADVKAGEKGKWFAIEGQKYCSKLTTAQQSCVFVDIAYGSGNVQSTKTPLSTYANQLNKLGSTDITEVIARGIKVALGVAGTISFALFIYAGVMLMISGGNSERTGKAKQTMVWATLGVFIIFASYAIVSFIFEAVK
jgi:hypothetical protein